MFFCVCVMFLFFILSYTSEFFFRYLHAGSRRSRNRSRGQLLVKNSKATTLQFESDFDFETANAQFKDDITKEIAGVFKGYLSIQFQWDAIERDFKGCACVYICFCELLQLKRWTLGRPRTARVCRRRKLWETNTTTKPNASLTTSHQTVSPGDDNLLSLYYLRGFVMLYNIYIFHQQENHLGGGEKVKHGNIWSSRPLPERQRIQGPRTWRAEHH